MSAVVANPLRPALLAAARSARLEAMVSRFPLTRTLVDRFVAGESESDAMAAVRSLLASGRKVSVDYLGEDTTDVATAKATVDAYLSLLQSCSALRTEQHDALEVSVKLSALGQGIARSLALDGARTICSAAARAGMWVTVDAEDHTTTDARLSVVRELRQEFSDVGTVLQAYLMRTADDCREFSGPHSRIRLCKGAYNEPLAVAYGSPGDVADSYVRCLRILMDGDGYPMVASHDPEMIHAAARCAESSGRTEVDYEYQMLFGIREAEQLRLAAEGKNLRVYVPYGNQWYGYFMRRLAERPANLMFFLRSLLTRK
ncbi:proline dehydrogenase [Rhodococcus sp. PAMC28707]|uniref:proline dehydrogenase family protein n=1 Tax=unclassified Rhodococcus (in: high G+C Gram-positive bacteria) TaxID=192944 RepID=UPI00109E0B52|nr:MULTISPECIES: proline dehydrogenase family protein [unclassified Rhodococcus (in: high G+C Gram-positive bacteria)]QCB50085.1 proline dehydrogenase [Rhodococcus sp. PAMC28705]QCB58220.1 proline dehydrogenase [Rhodococcus sp. PAMC28707]